MKPAVKAEAIRKILEPLGTAERALGEKKYLKSDLEFLGVGVPAVRKTAKGWLRQQPGLQRLIEYLVHVLAGGHGVTSR